MVVEEEEVDDEATQLFEEQESEEEPETVDEWKGFDKYNKGKKATAYNLYKFKHQDMTLADIKEAYAEISDEEKEVYKTAMKEINA